jgi:hypothetical protein
MEPLAQLVDRTRRQAGINAGHWFVKGSRVYEDREMVGHVLILEAFTATLAGYVANLHNVFTPLANAWILVSRALRDRAAMSRLLAAGKGRGGSVIMPTSPKESP